MTGGWLVDRSALLKLGDSVDAAAWADRIQQGRVRTSSITRLEIGHWARSADQARRAFRSAPLAVMPVEHLTAAAESRAMEVQLLLADLAPQGRHRAPAVPSLLIAATAELAGLTVLHADEDFDLIANVSLQPMERVRMAKEVATKRVPSAMHQPVR